MKYVRVRGYDVSIVFIGMLLIIIALGSSVVALILKTRDVSLSAQIEIVGDIRVYDSVDCVNELLSYDFGLYPSSGTETLKTKPFWIKNIGNVDVKVCWKMLTSSIPFTWAFGNQYEANVVGTTITKWCFRIPDVDFWKSLDDTTPEYVTIAKGTTFTPSASGMNLLLRTITGIWDPEILTFTVQFVAESV